ncbi:hypothetical protein NDU88_005513 [Pleurodeles waltl]|uniref:Uncharacterized protein n=1 Tax=Pleurodeles waltl TaxID=8319 RepID=A0AAV7MD54_PLEWA|nr:hypothetical protein NDU88_005513 [Pleurodeles waltl]
MIKRLLLVCRLGTRLEIGDIFTLNKITVLPTTSVSLAYLICRRGSSPDAADLRGKSLMGVVLFVKKKKKKKKNLNVVLAAFWCCLARHQKSGASADILVLPSATPEERSERGRNG